MTSHIPERLLSCFFCIILYCNLTCDKSLIVSHRDLNEQIVVLSLICPTFERQEVYVGSALPEVPPIDVSGARVQINDAMNTYTFKEVQPGLYRDIDGFFHVSPGVKYELYVETPDGKRVSASTRVPGKFEITNIATGDTLEYFTYFSGPPDLIWSQIIPHVDYTSSKEAYVYQIWVTLEDTSICPPNTPLTLETECDFPIIHTESNSNFISESKIVIFAWDSTYSNYASDWALLGFNSEFRADSSFSEFYKIKDYCSKTLTNVNGGLGIFGSANAASVEFYLKYRREVNP